MIAGMNTPLDYAASAFPGTVRSDASDAANSASTDLTSLTPSVESPLLYRALAAANFRESSYFSGLSTVFHQPSSSAFQPYNPPQLNNQWYYPGNINHPVDASLGTSAGGYVYRSIGDWLQTPLPLHQHFMGYNLSGGLNEAAGNDAYDAYGSALPTAENAEGIEGDLEEEGGETVAGPQKAMADFAVQRFRKIKKADDKKNDEATAGKKKRNGAGGSGTEGDEDVEAGLGPSRLGSPALNFCNIQDPEEDAEPLDEAAQAEADEFFSQLIQWPPAESAEEPSAVPAKNAAFNPIRRKNATWREEESEFFRRCCSLYDSNYSMIRELMPHRTVPELKKKYDQQREMFPLMFASFCMSARFDSMEEYLSLRETLEEERRHFEKNMALKGVKPWVDMLGVVHKDKDNVEDGKSDGEDCDQQSPPRSSRRKSKSNSTEKSTDKKTAKRTTKSKTK